MTKPPTVYNVHVYNSKYECEEAGEHAKRVNSTIKWTCDATKADAL